MSTNIPDINLLPQEYRYRSLLKLHLCLLFLIAISLVSSYLLYQNKSPLYIGEYLLNQNKSLSDIGSYFLYQNKSALDKDIDTLEGKIDQVEAQLDELRGKVERAEKIEGEVEAAKQKLQELQETRDLLASRQVSWASLISYSYNLASSGINLESISKEEAGLVITGSASSPESIWQYYENLSRSPEITEASMQSFSKTETSYEFMLELRVKK